MNVKTQFSTFSLKLMKKKLIKEYNKQALKSTSGNAVPRRTKQLGILLSCQWVD